MARTHSTSETQGGFSIVEVMTAITVLGLVASGIAAGMITSSVRLGQSRVDSVADQVAATDLESIRRLSYNQVGLVGGNPSGLLPPTATKVINGVSYAISREVRFVDNPTPGAPRTYANWKRVTIRVTPPRANVQPATKTTFFSPPSIDAVVGKSAIRVTLRRADNLMPFGNIPLTLDQGPSPLRTDVTTPDGRAVFANLEPNPAITTDPAYYYRLTTSITGFDLSRRSSIYKHVAPNQVVDMFMDYYNPITVAARLEDKETGAVVTAPATLTYWDSYYATLAPRNTHKKPLTTTTGLVNFTTLDDGRGVEPASAFASRITSQAACYENGDESQAVAGTITSAAPWVIDVYRMRSVLSTVQTTANTPIAAIRPTISPAFGTTLTGLPVSAPTTDPVGVSTALCIPPSVAPNDHEIRYTDTRATPLYADAYTRIAVAARNGVGGPAVLNAPAVKMALLSAGTCNLAITAPNGTANQLANLQSTGAGAPTYNRNLQLNGSRQVTYSGLPRNVSYIARAWNGSAWLTSPAINCNAASVTYSGSFT